MRDRQLALVILSTLAASVIVAAVQIPLHEGAHWLTCMVFRGDGCFLFYDISGGTVAAGVPRLIQAWAGPAIGLILVGSAAVVGQHRDVLGRAVAVAVIAIAGVRPVLFGGVYAWNWPNTAILDGADEVRIAGMMGLPPVTIILATLAVVVSCWWAVVRHIDRKWLVCLIPSIIVGGLVGTFLWLRWAGPILLPWIRA